MGVYSESYPAPTTFEISEFDENQYYIHVAATYRRAIFLVEAPDSRAGAPNKFPPNNPPQAKSNALYPHQAKALFTWPSSGTDLAAKGQSPERPSRD